MNEAKKRKLANAITATRDDIVGTLLKSVEMFCNGKKWDHLLSDDGELGIQCIRLETLLRKFHDIIVDDF